MNERHLSEDEQLSRVLDLLVDGELNETDRRQLISELEGLPDGWRRCALAFLEGQCWREAIPEHVSAPFAPASESRTAPSTTVLPNPASRIGRATWFAMAASLLVAFGLGIASRGSFGAREVAGRSSDSAFPVTESTALSSNAPGSITADPPSKGIASSSADSFDDQSTGEIWLPATDSGDGTTELELTAVLPNDLRKQLEESGHQLEQKQELWPVELSDGSRVILPVDRLEVRYVGDDFQ